MSYQAAFAKINKKRELLLKHNRLVNQACTDEELASIREAQKVSYLPKIYREFFQVNCHRPLDETGETPAYEFLKYVKKLAYKILLNEADLPEDSFIFWADYVHVFYYFRTGGEEFDPEVYIIRESYETEHYKYSEHLSEFLLKKLL